MGFSCSVRLHAARHSALVMCVPASQNPMQSASVLPPPPGALGADSLGDADPGDSARLLEPVEPPVENCVGSCGESGAMPGACGAGAASIDDGLEALGATGLVGGPLVTTPVGDVVLGRVGLVLEAPDLAWAIACPLRGATPPVTWAPPPADRAAAGWLCKGTVKIAKAASDKAWRCESMGDRPFPVAPKRVNAQRGNSFYASTCCRE